MQQMSIANLVKVSLHQLEDNINVLELSCTGRQHDVLDLHNICTTYNVEPVHQASAWLCQTVPTLTSD